MALTNPGQIFSGATKRAYEIGAQLPRKSFDVSKYQNLGAMPTANTTPRNVSTDFAQLGNITTDYGGTTRYEKFHPALDVANKIGTAIPSFSSGTVVEAVTGKKQGDKGYGNYVIVKDNQGNSWRYSHLNNAFVKVGSQVAKGAVIGEMGNTGSAYSTSGGTGSHLDLRIKNAYNKYVSPYSAMKAAT
jgi:murein DD-endopeptidase MepM/ murein hydrolase activator NlpD